MEDCSGVGLSFVGSFVVWSPRVVDAQWLIDVQSTGLCCAGLKEEIFKIVLC